MSTEHEDLDLFYRRAETARATTTASIKTVFAVFVYEGARDTMNLDSLWSTRELADQRAAGEVIAQAYGPDVEEWSVDPADLINPFTAVTR